MTSEKPEPSTQALLDSTARTRDRVARDVEQLAHELSPTQLKDRALDVTEHSLAKWAARALLRLGESPRRVAAYARKHPAAGVAIAAGAAVVVWRLAIGRHRSR
jgi:hypothetical protein